MRIKTVFFVASLAAFGATPALSQSGHDLFQQALVQEQAEGNLRSAIVLYTRVVSEFPLDRPLVARALVRIGRAHETLGSTEAQRAYQRIVSDYPDQQEQVAVARSRLAALTRPATVVEASGVVVRQVWTGRALDVSPDGRYLVFKDEEDLAVHDLRTGEDHRLAAAPGRVSDHPAISPDGRQLAYVSWNSEDAELRLRDLTGSRPRVLVSNPEVPWLEPFAWSPDGKQILTVFERNDRTAQIVLVSTADGSVRVLKSLEWRWPQSMSFSPDGRYIAYDLKTERDSPERDIFVLATDGSRESLLIARPAEYRFPVWTPDGSAILFASSHSSGSRNQWLIPVARGTAQGPPTLIKENTGRIQPLRFTTDGNYYYNLTTGRSVDVYIAALDSATGQPLGTPSLVSDRFHGSNNLPEWSPDGQHLAYVSFRDGRTDRRSNIITIRSLETGQERELTTQLAFFLPDTRLRWSPDGRSFLVGGEDSDGHRGLYQIDAQTGDVTPIVVASGEHRPGSSSNMWHAEWSLDGKAIFYVYDEDGESCEIRIRDMETGEDRLLYRADWLDNTADGPVPVHLSNLALSPDGRQLAFGSFRGSGGSGQISHFAAGRVLVMPTSGGEPRELLRLDQETEGWATYSFTWTRDGNHLLFSKRVAEPTVPSELWRVSAAGGEPQSLGLVMWGRGGVRAHPDGRRITFTNQTYRNNQLWMMENFLPQPSGGR